MTWSNVPGTGPQRHSEAERVAWEQGATSLFPPGRIADRVSTVLLLAAGAVLTVVAAVAGVIAVASAATSCGSSGVSCAPGGFIGGAVLAVGGAFVVGVVTLVFAVRAWIRRRTSWWIAGIGFVLTVAVVTWGTVLFAQALDQQDSGRDGGVGTAELRTS
ncbi:hypothetical protein DEJ24_07420 [Curtobacterium sp. MCPF17_001]|uniref:DUF6264 family protein n=1 Tax=Curtobacterium sp. MCPF17_001 TaxID=2175651 RepID=UPI000DA91647|nr:DUF6264 family protein [Curtobacterium sp. MCPF17_001]PZE59735.1 hypothetical protein DEJ24_07420 [Curtobacterium sp. MCPF17_001]